MEAAWSSRPNPSRPSSAAVAGGPFIDSFLRLNEEALTKLDVSHAIRSTDAGVKLVLCPGGRAGAIPLRSAQTGHVASGFLVEPRFGWAGVGRVLVSTGWAGAPEISTFRWFQVVVVRCHPGSWQDRFSTG